MSTGTSFPELSRLNSLNDFGSIFPYAVNIWQNKIVFLSNDGLYSFDGSNLLNLSEKIRGNTKNWFLGSTVGKMTNLGLKESSSYVYRDSLYLTVCEDEINTVTNRLNAFYIFTSAGTIWRQSSLLGIGGFVSVSNNKLVAAGIPSGVTNTMRLYEFTTASYDDDTGSIDAYWKTKEFDFKILQHFKYLYVDYNIQLSGILKVRYNVDQRGWVEREVDMSGTYGSIRRSQRLLIGVEGRTIQFEFANNQAYVNMKIYGLELHHDGRTYDNRGGGPTV